MRGAVVDRRKGRGRRGGVVVISRWRERQLPVRGAAVDRRGRGRRRKRGVVM